MRNPSQPLRSPVRHGLTTDELLALLARTRRWPGKDAAALVRAVATDLDEALRPDLVAVALRDPATGETVKEVSGAARDAGGLSAEQWHEWLAPQLHAAANGRMIAVAPSRHPVKLRVSAARVGVAGTQGYVAVASGDATFPRERDEMLLEVVTSQLGLVLASLPLGPAEAPSEPASVPSDDADVTGAPIERKGRRRAVAPEHTPDLRAMADAWPAAIAYIDTHHIYRFANHCYQEWFGLAPDDIVGRHIADVLGDEAYAALLPSIRRALTGERTTYETQLRFKDGKERFFRGEYVPDRDSSGNVRGYFGYAQDISERKRAEEALRESEEHHRRLLGALPMAVYTCDADGRITFYNRRAAELWGREPALNDSDQRFCGSFRLSLLDGTHLPHADTPMARALRSGEPVRNQEVVIERPDGSRIVALVNIDVLRDADGRIRGATNVFQDVTERRHLEEERAQMLAREREARAEAEQLLDLGLALNSELDLEAVLQRVTDAATAGIGAEFGAFFYNTVSESGEAYSLYTLSGAAREAFERFPMPRATALFGPTFRGEEVVRCEDVKRDPRYGRSEPYQGLPPGHLPVTSYLAVPVRARSGQVLGGLFFGHPEPGRFTEAHERVVIGIAAQAAVAIDNARLFDAVREQAERLRITYEHAPMGIAEADREARFQSVNERFCRIVGYPAEELIGRKTAELTHPDDVAPSAEQFQRLMTGAAESYQLEKRYLHKQGHAVWVRISVALVRDAGGAPRYTVAVVEDITERRRAEVVIHGQKQALEQMARGEPLAAVLATLVDTFERQSQGGASATLFLLDPDGRGLQRCGERDPAGAWAAAVQAVAEAPAICPCAGTGTNPVEMADVETDARWAPHRARALAQGFRSGWASCLRAANGTVLGTFAVLARESRGPSGQELRFLELLADTAVNAIERYRDEALLRAQAEVLNQVHDAVVMVALDGRILRWNAGAERLFEVRADEVLGRELKTLSPTPEAYAWLEANVIAVARRDGRYEGIVPLQRPSGSRLYAHMSLSLVHDEDGFPGAMVAYVLDVTARIEAEKALSARVRQQEAVAWLGKAALAGIEPQTLMDEAVRLVADTLGVELCKVLELDPDGSRLLLRAGVGWQEGLVGSARVGTDLDSQAGFTLVSKEPVVVTDLSSETRFSGPPLLREHGVVSGMSVIIFGDRGEPWGVLGAHARARRPFTGHDVNFLQSVAHILASALQRRRFEEAMRKARDELESRVAERTAELAQANQSLRDEVVERMGVESALRESEAQYRMLFERNPLPAWVFDIHTLNILAANETAVWQYGYTREEFLRLNIHDLHPPEEAARALDYAEQFAPETAYIGTWKHRKQDETTIDVEMFVYEVLFQGRWARLMLASDITERRRTEREFRLLETITRSISEAPDLDAALYTVLRHIGEATGWVLGEAWLPTADDAHMQCSRAWYCGAEGLEEFRHSTWGLKLARGHGVTGRAWATGQPTWVADVTDDETFLRRAQARTAGLRGALSFPVLAEGRVIALLTFFLREAWLEDEHEVKLVSTIARQAGIAIQRKQAEDRLRESEERFRLLVEGAHDYAIYMVDPEGRIASWNRGAERLNGYAAEEVLGQPVSLFYIPEEAGSGADERILAHARATGVYEGEGWRVRKGGERFWASVVITALRDARGGLRGFVKVTRDITERKRAEERLKESEARLARAQEFSLLMVAHVALDGRWLKVPPMLCATIAYREEELLSSRFEDVTHPDDFPAEWEQCQRLIQGKIKSFDLEKRFLRRDGKVIWAYQNTSIVLDADDRPLHFLTFIRDITQRKEAEEQLHRSRVQLSEAQRLAHLGSWEWDVASGRLEWSDELYRIYGVAPRSPITYETYMGHVHAEDRERVYRAIAAALETRQPFTVEERIVRADGELRYLLSQGAVVAGQKGEVARMVGVCLDITERKRAEERLQEYAHRLQSLSQRLLEAQEMERRRIARELHDQIGQDLSVIKINLQALQRLPGSGALGAHLEETVRIVESVLATARNLSVELRPSMLDDLGLVAALRWYLDRQAQRAGIILHFAADEIDSRLSPTIDTACFRLAQEALTNVLRHAAAKHVHVTLQHKGEQLEMRITDDGTGFDVENARARASRGESFGLLGMEERALLAGGQLEIISAPGQGSTVVARFPLTSNTVQSA